MSTNPHFSLRDLLEKPDLVVAPPNENVEDKVKNLEDDSTFDFSSAFLGPVLWDKTLPFDEEDFKLESLGLQEFFDENDLLPSGEHEEQLLQPTPGSSPVSQASVGHVTPPTLPPAQDFRETAQVAVTEIYESRPEPKTSYEPSAAEQEVTLVTIPGQDGFDPRKRRFTEDELKPQPMIKKSKKMYVPENLKDDHYWGRRNKNNVAAKRSRDARRVKENQIAMRAAFLEKQNGTLKSDLEKLQAENMALKKHLSQYEMQAKLAGNAI